MGDKERDFGEKCPVCDTKWTKIPRPVVAGFWTVCNTCEKKAEDLVPPPVPKSTQMDMLQEFEDLLDSKDDDDWWTFLKAFSTAQLVQIANSMLEEGAITTPEEYIRVMNGEKP